MSEENSNLNDYVAKHFEKISGSQKLSADIRKKEECVYAEWQRYRRFDNDKAPDPHYFERFEFNHGQRGFAHKVFKLGPNGIKRVSKYDKSDIKNIIDGYGGCELGTFNGDQIAYSRR